MIQNIQYSVSMIWWIHNTRILFSIVVTMTTLWISTASYSLSHPTTTTWIQYHSYYTTNTRPTSTNLHRSKLPHQHLISIRQVKSLSSSSRTVLNLKNEQSISENDATILNGDMNIATLPTITTTTTKASIQQPIVVVSDVNPSRNVSESDASQFTSYVNYSSSSSTLRLQYAAYDMICAGIVGIVTGIVVAYFKLSIESVRVMTYSWNILDYLHNEVGAILIPIAGGICVGLLISSGPFSPGLRGKVSQVEDISNSIGDRGNDNPIVRRIQQQVPLFRKTTAAICTLGTGCSLGPEGPCVELGMGISRSCMDLFDRRPLQQQQEDQSKSIEVMSRSTWNRILLSCGAAAGVSAGFDAPVAGVFFVLEVMQAAFNDVSKERRRQKLQQARDESAVNNSEDNAGGLFSSSATLSPVLLSSVLAALCARSILGDHLTFNVANTDALSASPLIELPMFLLLGSICGVVAFSFSQSAKFSRSFFQGEVGSEMIRNMMQSLSPNQKPLIGGLFCGVTALLFPQILFFGYETLNSLLSNTVSVPTNVLLSLLFVKAIATAVCIGSGLVGGTLAPALFLGGVTGASFHNIISDLYQFVTMHSDGITTMMNTASDPSNLSIMNTFVLADLPDYAMVGSASVLAALFRAPLTASLLLFELSRDYDVILPIIASAGVGSVVADILEDTFVINGRAQKLTDASSKAHLALRKVRRDQDSASWGDLADKDDLNVVSSEVNDQKQ